MNIHVINAFIKRHSVGSDAIGMRKHISFTVKQNCILTRFVRYM